MGDDAGRDSVSSSDMWKLLEESPLEDRFKDKLKSLLVRWTKNYKNWLIGSFPALKKKIGKTVDTILAMYMPANHLNELMHWLDDWSKELNLSEEDLSEYLSTIITSIQSTHAPTQAGRAGASSRTSLKRKKTLDDCFESLQPSKRSHDETGKISQSIFVRQGDEQRSLKSLDTYKDYLLKLQLYPTLQYQAKMEEDRTQAWRTAMIRLNFTVDQKSGIFQRVLELTDAVKDEIKLLLAETEESEELQE